METVVPLVLDPFDDGELLEYAWSATHNNAQATKDPQYLVSNPDEIEFSAAPTAAADDAVASICLEVGAIGAIIPLINCGA